MRISVVMPVKDGAKTLQRTLEAFSTQTVRPDEIIVINDGSTDETGTMLEAASRDLPLCLLRHDCPQGVAKSLRAGVAAASGDLILRCDADDWWHDTHAQVLRSLAEGEPGATMVASRAVLVDEQNALVGQSPIVSEKDVRWRLGWDNPFVHSAVGFRREAYLAAGGYDPDRRWEDYDLWVRLLSEGALAAHDQPTITYRIHAASASRVAIRQARQERFAIQRKASRAFARRHPFHYAIYDGIAAFRRLTGGAL